MFQNHEEEPFFFKEKLQKHTKVLNNQVAHPNLFVLEVAFAAQEMPLVNARRPQAQNMKHAHKQSETHRNTMHHKVADSELLCCTIYTYS